MRAAPPLADRRLKRNTVGFSESRIRVPNTQGVTGYCQFVWMDPCAPRGWSASHALEIVIQ